MFNMVIKNFQKSYSWSGYLTMDKMSFAHLENDLCRIYMKSKSAKYGIKIMCLCNSKTHCLDTGFIYSAKSDFRGRRNSLCRFNWLIWGVCEKISVKLHQPFLEHKTWPIDSTLLGFSNDKTLPSYVPKTTNK